MLPRSVPPAGASPLLGYRSEPAPCAPAVGAGAAPGAAGVTGPTPGSRPHPCSHPGASSLSLVMESRHPVVPRARFTFPPASARVLGVPAERPARPRPRRSSHGPRWAYRRDPAAALCGCQKWRGGLQTRRVRRLCRGSPSAWCSRSAASGRGENEREKPPIACLWQLGLELKPPHPGGSPAFPCDRDRGGLRSGERGQPSPGAAAPHPWRELGRPQPAVLRCGR